MELTGLERERVTEIFEQYKTADPEATFMDCVHRFRKEYGYFGTKYLKPALDGYDMVSVV